MHRLFISFSLFFTLLLISAPAFSHCEIPCGIYDDKMRIAMLEEHIATIEKAMGQIMDLQDGDNKNQLIRWVVNKEDHADQFQEIVSRYFLTQRIKKEDKQYGQMLEVLHQMLVYAMKCKQTVDPDNAAKLKELVREFDRLYFAPHS